MFVEGCWRQVFLSAANFYTICNLFIELSINITLLRLSSKLVKELFILSNTFHRPKTVFYSHLASV